MPPDALCVTVLILIISKRSLSTTRSTVSDTRAGDLLSGRVFCISANVFTERSRRVKLLLSSEFLFIPVEPWSFVSRNLVSSTLPGSGFLSRFPTFLATSGIRYDNLTILKRSSQTHTCTSSLSLLLPKTRMSPYTCGKLAIRRTLLVSVSELALQLLLP